MFKKIIGRFKKPKQYTFIYCPKCNNEMIANGHAIEHNDEIVKYECGQCGNISFWDFIHYPIPVLRTCADCHWFSAEDEDCTICTCDPDTQRNFIYEATWCEYCDGAKPLVIGKTNDQGIAVQRPDRLMAYGYDVHGTGSNGLIARIDYCPMCGKKL